MAEAFTVAEVNRYIKDVFIRDYVLNRIRVRGEVSNCKYHDSGHIYFTLKDNDASLSCVMFARDRQFLSFRLQNGQQIEAAGQITIYEKAGSYSLHVKGCALSGAGELYERFLKLKAKLQDMGMFDGLYKKAIPAYCMNIGVVTSPTGAAIRDIERVSRDRNPYVQLVLCPALVQGDGAPESIARGIERLDELGLDCIIVGRGGGSIEDLWAFNDERVAQAIFDADTPIISAVGHETDYTIADFVADARAATPSAAAELANFVYTELEEELEAEKADLKRIIRYRIADVRSGLAAKIRLIEKYSPAASAEHSRHRIREYKLRMGHAVSSKADAVSFRLSAQSSRLKPAVTAKAEELKNRVSMQKNAAEHTARRKFEDTGRRLAVASARLDGLSPLKKLGRGYGYIEDADGRNVKSIETVHTGDRLKVYLADGSIAARAESTERLSLPDSW